MLFCYGYLVIVIFFEFHCKYLRVNKNKDNALLNLVS